MAIVIHEADRNSPVASSSRFPDDVHVVITGDADVLPAIKVAYPEYSKNVFIATRMNCR